MRVEQGEPVGDEDQDFLATLAQFKEGLAANVDATDFQTHYDLGIAFKEMGLLDEAVAQFQKALRAPGGHLRSAEALGTIFFEKGQYGVAEAVLERAIETLAEAEGEKIGLLYWIGRAVEAQGRSEQAVHWYERAMAVDITFSDVNERLRRLVETSRS
jgi:tetratricopeptide (TPR) repeat protein